MEINGKEISKELMDKAAKCETVEELLALARENGIELTAEQAEEDLPGQGERHRSDCRVEGVIAGYGD